MAELPVLQVVVYPGVLYVAAKLRQVNGVGMEEDYGAVVI